MQMVPEDSWWPVGLGAPYEGHPEVVDSLREGLVYHLERVDRGGQHRIWPKYASLDQEGHLEV
jgi:hypothetical protein